MERLLSWIKENKRKSICIITILYFVIPIILSLRFSWGSIPYDIAENLLAYYGTMLSGLTGGVLTLGGVWWTIKKQEEEKKMEFDINNCPLLTAYLVPNEKLSLEEELITLSDRWYIGYSINLKIKLQNSIPIHSFRLINREFENLDEAICPRLWIFESNLEQILNSKDDELYINSLIDFDPGVVFIDGRQETSSSITSIAYFSFMNPFEKEYVLKVKHQLAYHSQRKNCTNGYRFSNDYQHTNILKTGEKIYHSEYISCSIIYDEKEIERIKSKRF